MTRHALIAVALPLLLADASSVLAQDCRAILQSAEKIGQLKDAIRCFVDENGNLRERIRTLEARPGGRGTQGPPGPAGPSGFKGEKGDPGSTGTLTATYRRGRFSNVPTAAVIPESRNATYCALSWVDDDSPDGFCYVWYAEEAKEWMHRTGAGGGANQCGDQCIWLSLQ